MWTEKIYTRNFLLGLSILLTAPFIEGYSQQDVIAHKNNTRTDVTRPFSNAVGITYFTASRSNGFNDIVWSAHRENDTRRFIVEYSTDGIYYNSAGEVISSTGNYQLKHHIFELQPLLYRLKIEGSDGKYVYSRAILLDGQDKLPVKIYPTIITGSQVNAISDMPVERISIVAPNGQQVFTQSVGGKDNYISIPLPSSLAKGMYWITFTGNGWQSTDKFIIP